jgi:drug/metabolite transporter (DMT)-like permease
MSKKSSAPVAGRGRIRALLGAPLALVGLAAIAAHGPHGAMQPGDLMVTLLGAAAVLAGALFCVPFLNRISK